MIYSIEHLKQDLTGAGIVPGDTLLVHSSMKKIGNVENRAEGVISALMETLDVSASSELSINIIFPVFG